MMTNERHLYILAGLPLAGKSTLARALVAALGAEHIELDAINAEMGLGLNGAAIAPEDWDRSYAESYRRVEEALNADRNVIFDATNFTWAQREWARALAARHGARARVIYVDVSPAVARERWQRNRVTSERFDVRDEDFARVVEHFEVPTDEERALRYEPGMALDVWIARHLTED